MDKEEGKDHHKMEQITVGMMKYMGKRNTNEGKFQSNEGYDKKKKARKYTRRNRIQKRKEHEGT